MLCAFGKHAFEAKLNKLRSDVVEVNELCIAYNLGLDAETVAEIEAVAAIWAANSSESTSDDRP